LRLIPIDPNKCIICGDPSEIGFFCAECYEAQLKQSQYNESMKNLSYIFSEGFYNYFLEKYPDKKVLGVQEFYKYEKDKSIKKDKTSNVSREYNHIIGRILSVEHFKDSGDKYFKLKDLYNNWTIRILAGGIYDELIDKDVIGEKVTLFIIYKSETNVLKPAYIKFDRSDLFDNPYMSEKLKRVNHRRRTYHLYSAVWKRDKGQCQMCHTDLGQIDVHHKDYEEKANDEEYLKSMWLLCRKCHEKQTQEQIRAQQFNEQKNHKLNEY
jgi:hypothetical protein